MKSIRPLLAILLLRAGSIHAANCPDYNSYKNAYFGDLHSHSSYSLDAYNFGTRTDPVAAYAFATGAKVNIAEGYDAGKGQVPGPNGVTISFSGGKLDFLGLTDHSEFLSSDYGCTYDTASPFYQSPLCAANATLLSAHPTPRPCNGFADGTATGCQQEQTRAWKAENDATTNAYQPCTFTTFHAFEWTHSSAGLTLHKNVFFNGETVPAVPLDSANYKTAPALWAGLAAQCQASQGCEALTIPHNGNMSGGLAFNVTGYTAAQFDLMMQYQKLVEIHQHKGNSECLTDTADTGAVAACDFEIDPADASSQDTPGYVRPGLEAGITTLAASGFNPLQLGFVGATDNHDGTPGNVGESTWPGFVGANDNTPTQRLQGETQHKRNPGGITGVWAEENTRESIWAALQRRETFATSGPKIAVRFYAYSGGADPCADAEFPKQLVNGGAVPMGGALPHQSAAPNFVVYAMKDQADLAEVDIVKASVVNGSVKESVHTIPLTSPPYCVKWQDPGFVSDDPAFYYARAKEVPTWRWSHYDCLRLKASNPSNWQTIAPGCASSDPSAGGLDVTIQERAWASPIWYLGAAVASPTATTTAAVTATPTRTAPVPTPTATNSVRPPTPTATAVVGRSATPTPSHSVITATPTTSGTPAATPTLHPCVGDCGHSGSVTVDKVLTMVRIALGNLPLTACVAGDANRDGQITIDEILAAVEDVVNGCSPQTAGAATFYVALNGNDAWTGALPTPNAGKTDGPFATFDRARAAVQALDKSGLSQVAVQFRAGTYFLPATEQFTAADSGTAGTPIVYQNYPSEAPVISGGVRVQNWTNVGGNTWKTTLPASTPYFENLFYNGVRRLRPRLGGELGTYYRIVGPVYLNAPGPPAAAPDPNCSIYVSGKGWECFDRFQYDAADPIVHTWKNLAPPVANPCGQPAGNPALVGDIELVDFERYNVARLRVSCIDPLKHILYLTGPTLISQSDPSANGFLVQHRYVVENVQDALTQPGQWFLDRAATPWTLTYLANAGENPNTDTVIVPQLAQVLVASDLQYVTFQGLTFAHDNFVLPAAGNGNPQYEVPAAVSFQNSQNITFDSSSVTHTSGAGLEFISCINAQVPGWCAAHSATAVTSNNVVQNSAFFDIGLSAVRVGMPGQSSDTEANVPQFTTVENNVVEGYGRVFPGAFGIIQGDGHDNTYTHNDVSDGYKGAIHVCFCSGPAGMTPLTNNNTISFNHVYNLFQGIMNDGGALYFETANGQPPHAIGSGNKMLNNKVHDVSDASALDGDGYGGDGLYIDDFTGSIDVENNLVYRVSGNALSFSGPRAAPNESSTIKNNIFAFARTSLINAYNPYSRGATPPTPMFFVATNNLFYFDRGSASSPAFYAQGGCTYTGGVAYTAFQQWDSNLFWRTDGGFAIDPQAFHVQPNPATNTPCAFGDPSKWNVLTLAGWQTIGEDVHSVVKNPGLKNPAYPADDYSLPAGSPGVGFTVFDPNQAGRSNPVINPPPVPATFPTKMFDPATDY